MRLINKKVNRHDHKYYSHWFFSWQFYKFSRWKKSSNSKRISSKVLFQQFSITFHTNFTFTSSIKTFSSPQFNSKTFFPLFFTFPFPTAMFCSKNCMDEATSTFLQAENDSKVHDIKQRMLFEALAICGGSFDKLKQLMEDPELSNKTIFDFDLNDVNDPNYKYNMLLSINSLAQIGVVKREIVKYMDRHPALDLFESREEKQIAKAFMIRAFRILTVNSFGVEWVIPAKPKDRDQESVNTRLAGDGLNAFGSLMNHSCIPNVDRVIVENKFVFFVRRPIKSGQQLFTCYGSGRDFDFFWSFSWLFSIHRTLFADAPREMRQETLKEEYGFLCSCEACTLDYPAPYGYPWTDCPLIITERSSITEWKRNFKENCETIAESQETLTNLEMCKIMLRNLYYLVAIAKTEPFIF